MIKHRILIFAGVSGVSCLFQFRIQVLERFSYDLESENARTKQSHLIGLSSGYKRAWLLVD